NELQEAVVDALARSGSESVPSMFLAGWSGHSPALRSTIQQALLTRPAWSAELLDAIDKGLLRAADFDASARERLLAATDESVRTRAEQHFGSPESSNRSHVVASYAPAAEQGGDEDRGRRVFEKSCASCHKLAGLGNEFGPNLAALTDKSAGALVTSLLDPNKEVEAKYRGYTVLT